MKIEVVKLNKKTKIFNNIKKYKKQIFITIFLAIISLLFIFNSSKYIAVVLEGILLYGTKILPTLLPFFFVTKILSNFDFIFSVCNQFSKLTKFLFNTKAISFYIFFMSIISGYPVGAKLTAEFYENRLITKTDAQKILSFCSTSGPLFIIGTVGVGFFCNEFLGILIFLIHIFSSILNGIIFRNFKDKKSTQNTDDFIDENLDNNSPKLSSNFSLQDCMTSSINSVLLVGGYVIIFYVLIQILLDFNILYPLIKLFNLLGLPLTQCEGLVAGMIEITKGISLLSLSGNLRVNFVITNFLISFSGISIIMQASAFLDKISLNKKVYFFQKFIHGILSLVISIIVSILIF